MPLTWATHATQSSKHPIRDCICVGTGKYVAIGTSGKVITSADGGSTWTSRTASSANDWGGLAFDGTTVVAVAYAGASTRVMRSTDDGHTWAAASTVPEANNWKAVCSPAAGTFIAVASNGTNRVMVSTDSGVNWTAKAASSALAWCGVATNGTLTVVWTGTSGSSTMVSSDSGNNWTSYATAPAVTFAGNAVGTQVVGYSPALTKFVIAGYDGSFHARVYTSSDGQTWASITDITTHLGWVGWAIADTYGGFFGSLPNTSALAATPKIIGWSTDAGANWTKEDTTFSGSNWAAGCWDPGGSTVVFFDEATDTALVGTVAPPPATVTRVVPSLGRVAGGKLVKIYGTNFTGASVVTFGGSAATLLSATSTVITARTPAHASGFVTVVVDGVSLVNGYHYTDQIFGDLTVRQEQGITITKELNDAPDECQFTSDGVSSLPAGSPVQIIDPASGATLFGGTALVTTDGIDGTPVQPGHQGIQAGDLTWRLNALRPIGTWTDVSASTIYQDLIDQFAPQFTGFIEAGLPVCSLTCDRSQMLSAVFSTLAALARCSWRPDDDFGVHVFTSGGSPAPGVPPDPVTDDTPLYDPLPTVVTDITQVRNLVYVHGAGGATSYEAAVDPWPYFPNNLINPVTPTAGGSIPNVTTQSYSYFITYVTAFGETLPHDLTDRSIPLLSGANHSYQLAELDTTVSPDARVTGRRIWRTRSSPDTVFGGYPGDPKMGYLVTTLGNASGMGEDTFLDTLADAQLTQHTPTTDTTGTVFAMVEDTAAQTALAALLNVDGGSDDGVREGYISDASLTTQDQATARGNAELTLFAYPIQTVTYACRDEKSVPGEDVSITLTRPPVSGVFKIQSVSIDQIQVDGGGMLFPRFHVTASSVRFTLDDLLRGVLLGGGGSGGAGGGSSASGGGGGTTTTTTMYGPEVPTGVIGGSPGNTVYSTVLAFTRLLVFKNGLLMTTPTDYTVTGTAQFTMVLAPVSGDSLVVYYL